MKRKRLVTRLLIILPIFIAGGIGWYYLLQRPCSQVEIIGTKYADSESMYRLIEAVFSAPLIVDRMQRHPWIRGVRAVCYPTGTMQIRIDERLPRLLALTRDGSPAYYLDEFGYMMPTTTQLVFDVPLIRGITTPYHPLLPIRDHEVKNLAALMPRLPVEVISLISEFEINENGLTMMIRFTDSEQTVLVNLGNKAWGTRVQRLYDLWSQGIWPPEDQAIGFIDLRFHGQIITRETPI